MSRRNPPQRTEQEIAEEEELQLALALSRSEAENKEKEYWRKESERERLRKNYGVYGGGNAGGQPPTHSEAPQPAMIPAIDTADMDPELARYLNRNYWQKRSEETTGKMATTAIPSAPNAASSPLSAPGKTVAESGPTNSEQPLQNGDQRELDKAQFLAALQSSLEIFVNRMRSNSQRGRPIANDSSVQSLFTVISNMHPQLLKYQQEMEDSRGYYEGLQDKLTQLRDAREALDSLREEHREKRRREMEEQERLRQIQMMQKLEVMRQKKHEYLEMQRQLALQRLQEQEREMAMRLEQQKQLTHMRQMQAYGYPQQMYGQQQLGGQQSMMSGGPGMMPPGVGGPGMVQGYGPGPQSTEGSPVHQLGGYGQNVAQQQQQGGLEGPGGAMQGPLPQSQGVYMGPGVAQSAYSQAQGGFTPQMSSMPGGYQPPPQGQGQLDGGQGQPGYNMPPSSMGYTDPNMPPVGQPSMQYTSMPPTMEYNSFNMQSMAQSLPQQQPPQGGGGGGMYPNQPAAQQPPPGQPPQQQQQQQQPQQQQQYMGGQYPPSNVSNNQMSGQQPPHHPPPTHQQPPLPHQHPPSHQQHQQSLLDAQLISFD